MSAVIPISEAKANLSKLVQGARAGETIYVGACGRAEAVIALPPERRAVFAPEHLGAKARDALDHSDALAVGGFLGEAHSQECIRKAEPSTISWHVCHFMYTLIDEK
ncbi:hypothetical protein GCM10022240_07890 [Microbacterium kribbense]|uniref:Antitoxin n=1 Tax=Microbacterium kribbense TaxID=433645 RepID=A0ABP7G7Z4_9MICO